MIKDGTRDFVGVPEQVRPYCPEVRADMTCWDIVRIVNARLKRAGMPAAAEEFRRQAPYADDDNGMLFTLALHYIKVSEEE